MSTTPSDHSDVGTGAFNMRFVSLSQFRNSKQTTQRTQIAIQKAIIGSITNPAKSLDLLRQTLQPDINRELDEVLHKYISRFFRPGLRNIRDNEKILNTRTSLNKELITSVNEVILSRICKQMLEEAAKRYIVQDVNDSPDDASDADSETKSETSGMSKRRKVESYHPYETGNSHASHLYNAGAHGYGTPTHMPNYQSYHPSNTGGRRKRGYDAESVAASECTSQRSGSQRSIASRSRGAHKFYTISPLAVAHGEPVRPASANPSHLVADRAVHPESLARPASANPHTSHRSAGHGSHSHLHRVGASAQSSQNDAQFMRSDASRLDETSLFVLGSHANKALGLGAIRGKIYAKHSWLFKYVCDSEDKQWLANEASILHSSGGKAILLLRSDVIRLAETSEYRNIRIDFSKLRSFTVPNWMILKMRRGASNVPDTSASASATYWSAAHTEAAWSASSNPNLSGYADGWPPNAHANVMRHQQGEGWSTAQSSGQLTPTDSRTAADSDDDSSRGDREPLPFARLAGDATVSKAVQSFTPSSGVRYSHVQPHTYSTQSAAAFVGDRHPHAVYQLSHGLVESSSSQALELSGTFDLVDGDGDAVLGHGVAVEEVVTSNENDENEMHADNEVHESRTYYE